MDEQVGGEALCKEKQEFCVTETATVTETPFEDSRRHKIRHTHTHTHTLPYTSDHIVTQAVTYITYNKHNRRISMPSEGFEPAIAEINQLQPTPHTV